MTIPMLLCGVLAMTFFAAIVPIGPTELYLAATVTTQHLQVPVAAMVAAAAAVGQVSGKFVVFGCTRRGTKGASRFATRVRSVRPLRRLTASDAAHPGRLFTMVAASAVTGIPPFAIVVPVAGAGGIRSRTFLVISMAGRMIRFLLIAIPIAM